MLLIFCLRMLYLNQGHKDFSWVFGMRREDWVKAKFFHDSTPVQGLEEGNREERGPQLF